MNKLMRPTQALAGYGVTDIAALPNVEAYRRP